MTLSNLSHSKTIIVNVVVLLSTWVLNHSGLLPQLGLDADWQVTILAVANLVLRWLTTKPLAAK